MTGSSHLLRRVILVVALLLPVPALCAGFTCASSTNAGEKGVLEAPEIADDRDPDALTSGKDMQAWLKRLVGQYTYGGFVDLCGKGNPKDQRPVAGKADCIAAGPTPAVHCRVNVTWSAAYKENGAPVLGGVSTLAPAELLFGMEIPTNPMTVGKGPNGWGLVVLQQDSNGEAEWASGELLGDTFYSRSVCFDIPGDCHKSKWITARPESDEISMVLDITIDRQRVLRQSFILHRKPNARQPDRAAGSAP
jgi:hypothetical protein